MSKKVLYSYTGLFDTPDEIISAANKTAARGFKKYDVNTPYPVHGMDAAMKLPPSKLGYVALVVGLSGALAALLFMFWTAAIEYPQIIGGKPDFAFPAYVPVTFEVTVLSASLATVIAMLVVFFKVPNLTHPLHDSEYMKNVSVDKYGISIQADDEMFNEEEVKNFLESIGAKNILPVYFDDTEIKHRMFAPGFIMILITVALLTSGSTYFALNKLMFMAPFNWMMLQEKTISQESSQFFEDGFGMRQPVKGSVARGFLPVELGTDADEISESLINPLIPTDKNFELGKKNYDIFCSPCHGYHAEGDTRLRGQFPNPPSLHSEKVRNWSDGRIFYVISKGQNIMPAYSKQMSTEKRWATVLYLRALQRSLNAKESDIK